MTYDDLSILKEFSERAELNYPLLRDEQVRHVQAFDIQNKQYGEGHKGFGIPLPGVMYIDAEGIIRAKFAFEGYKNRPEMQDILDAVAAIVASAATGPAG